MKSLSWFPQLGNRARIEPEHSHLSFPLPFGRVSIGSHTSSLFPPHTLCLVTLSVELSPKGMQKAFSPMWETQHSHRGPLTSRTPDLATLPPSKGAGGPC